MRRLAAAAGALVLAVVIVGCGAITVFCAWCGWPFDKMRDAAVIAIKRLELEFRESRA